MQGEADSSNQTSDPIDVRHLILLAALACTAAPAQQTALRDPGRKSVRVVRAPTPPVIDGVLDDAVWANAGYIDDLHQVNPTEYAEPSERTEIYILYDDDALYIGARMHDSDPDRITANVMRQNGNITQDDTLFVTLDPFNTRRSGYFFGINPHAVRFDGLYRNVSEYYSDWDGIFDAATGEFENGWTIEYAIPFKTLSFDPNTDTWGLNFSRSIQRRNEDIAWSTRNRRWDPSVAGQAVGFEGLRQGVGLDIVPSAAWTHRREFSTPLNEGSEFEPSLDLAYKLTPAMNASLTINTDFSATEVDDRQVNLSRFNLFFPEKRDFFLREADIFEFGRIGAQNGNGTISNAERQNGRPVFSRKIGLGAAGEAVDLDYGGKVSGRVGRWEIGALSIRQDSYAYATPDEDQGVPGPVLRTIPVDADNLSVIRAKANVLDESTIGTIFTEGDPSSNLDNSLAGIDFLYRNSRLPGGRTFEAEAWYQQSDTEGFDGDDAAMGIGFSVPSNAGLRGGLSAKEFERNYNPALGFLSRRDVRDYSGHIAYTHRPDGGYWQSLYFGIDGQRYELLGGGLQSQRIGVTPLEITNRTGDLIFVRANFERDVLPLPFEIYPDVVIPAGAYRWDDFGAEWRGSEHRKFSGRIALIDGDFYGGTRDRWFGEISWTPSPRFAANVGFNYNDIELPQGSFRTRIVSTELDIVFSSTLSWINLIQYDNVSERMGINSRLHWIPVAGREVYFVINHGLEDLDGDNDFHSEFSDATVKVNYTFRF
jgi:hypothetical protein